MAYSVSTWGATAERETFGEALETHCAWSGKTRHPVSVCNLDLCDHADEGWDNGLTAEEREQLEEENHVQA